MSIVVISHFMVIKIEINYVTSVIVDFSDLVLMKLGALRLRSKTMTVKVEKNKRTSL